MRNFDYHIASDVKGAEALLKAKEDGKLMAGGMTLLPTMKQRLAAPDAIIDLAAIAGLKGIAREGDTLVIGAMTRHAEVATSDVVKAAIPGLALLASRIGDVRRLFVRECFHSPSPIPRPSGRVNCG
jgi:carbon-monoxide dehydrogenase medium subunit